MGFLGLNGGGGAWPAMLDELLPPEQLIVRSFRRWLAGWARQEPREWSLVWNEFSREFGAKDGRAALSSLVRVINGLHLNACRTLEYHQPCCPCVGADEACLVKIVAACQHEDWRLAYAAGASLVGTTASPELVACATSLAQSMRRHGMTLPRRSPAPIQGGSGDGLRSTALH